MIPFGNVPIGSVLPIPFASYAGATGASVTLSGLAVTDIEVYKGTSMTQRASDAGYVLLDSDGIDIDGLTGIHGFSIDTGDNTDAGFYAAGSFYSVIVSAVTIDSQTVNFVAATFRLVAAENTAGVPAADAVRIGGAAQAAANVGELANRLATLLEAAPGSPSEFRFTADSLARTLTAIGMQAGNMDAQLAALLARLPAALVGGRMDSSVGAMAANTLTASALAADAVTEIQNGLATSAALAIAQAVLDRFTTMLETAPGSPGESRFTADALVNGPAGSGGGASAGAIAAAVWDVALPGAYAAGRAGHMVGAIIKVVADRLLTMLEAAGGSPGEFRYSADALVNSPAGSGGGASAGAIADAVWDELLAGHLGPGSAGAALVVAGAAGDRLLTMTEPAAGSPGEWKLTPDALRAIISVTPTAIQNADALLDRDMAAGVDSGSASVRTPRQAFRILRNRWAIVGTTQSIKKEDDSTESWTQELGTTPGTDPVTSTDPAGP